MMSALLQMLLVSCVCSAHTTCFHLPALTMFELHLTQHCDLLKSWFADVHSESCSMCNLISFEIHSTQKQLQSHHVCWSLKEAWEHQHINTCHSAKHYT